MMNTLKLFSKIEDELNFIQAFDKKTVVYSIHGQLFTTSCLMIKEFWLPDEYDQCTKDLPVIIDNTKVVYLTKTGILRSKSHIITCKIKPDEFEINDQKVLKQYKKNKIVKNIKKFFLKSQETFSIDILSKFLEKSKFFNVYRDFIDIFLPIFLVLIFGKTKAQKLIKYFRKNRHRFSKPDELQKDLQQSLRIKKQHQ